MAMSHVYEAVRGRKVSGWDGPVALSARPMVDSLEYEMRNTAPKRTGRGAASISARVDGGRMPKMWRISMYGYMRARSEGAVIPPRPIWKTNPKPMAFTYKGQFMIRRRVKGYTITGNNWIEKSLGDFADLFVKAICWSDK